MSSINNVLSQPIDLRDLLEESQIDLSLIKKEINTQLNNEQIEELKKLSFLIAGGEEIFNLAVVDGSLTQSTFNKITEMALRQGIEPITYNTTEFNYD